MVQGKVIRDNDTFYIAHVTIMYELYLFDQNNGRTCLFNNTYNNKKLH